MKGIVILCNTKKELTDKLICSIGETIGKNIKPDSFTISVLSEVEVINTIANGGMYYNPQLIKSQNELETSVEFIISSTKPETSQFEERINGIFSNILIRGEKGLTKEQERFVEALKVIIKHYEDGDYVLLAKSRLLDKMDVLKRIYGVFKAYNYV